MASQKSSRRLSKKSRLETINILIRTSERPRYFRHCYQSILEQTYKSIRVIVSWDNESTWDYIKNYKDIVKIKVNGLDSDLSHSNDYPPLETLKGR